MATIIDLLLVAFDVILALCVLGAFLYARPKFTPGLFRKLLDLLVCYAIVRGFVVLYNAASFFNPSLVSHAIVLRGVTLLVSVIFLLVAAVIVKMAKEYGFGTTEAFAPVAKAASKKRKRN